VFLLNADTFIYDIYLPKKSNQLVKDIIRRFRIRKESLFRAVADFVLRSNGRIVSYNSIYIIREKLEESSFDIMLYRERRIKDMIPPRAAYTIFAVKKE